MTRLWLPHSLLQLLKETGQSRFLVPKAHQKGLHLRNFRASQQILYFGFFQTNKLMELIDQPFTKALKGQLTSFGQWKIPEARNPAGAIEADYE